MQKMQIQVDYYLNLLKLHCTSMYDENLNVLASHKS